MKGFARTVGAVAAIVVAEVGCAKAEQRADDRMAIEASIYSAVVESIYMGNYGDTIPAARPKEVLVSAHTQADLSYELAESWLRDSVPEAPDQLPRAFKEANKESGPAPPLQIRDATVRVLSDSTLAQFFNPHGDGWEGVRRAYPMARGILTLSRVGLSSDGQWALVYAGIQADFLGGGGSLYVLRNVAGQWRLEREHMLWIS